MEEPKITLDQSTFKALAAGTRVKILKTLEKRRHTQSELSADLDMSVPTVKEHLAALEKAGLVTRHEEGRKWIYYSLTEKSKCILDPERKRLWIVLGFFLASLAGLAITARNYFIGSVGSFAGGAEKAQMLAMPAEEAVRNFAVEAEYAVADEIVTTAAEAAPTLAKAAPEAADMVQAAAPEAVNNITRAMPEVTHAAVSQPPYVLIGFILLTIVLFILAIYFLSKSRVLKKK